MSDGMNESTTAVTQPAPMRAWVVVTVLFALAALATRIPLLRAPILLDGDEAIVGLQAIACAEGAPLPMLFPGQKYGVTAFEAGLASLLFRVGGAKAVDGGITAAGASEAKLRFAALLIWIAAGALAILFASRWGMVAMIVVALLFVANPAWYLWSVKARGGYGTAYMMAMLALVLGSSRLPGTPLGRLIQSFAFGAVVCLIPLVQPTWTSLAAVFFIGYGFPRFRERGWILGALGGVLCAGAIAAYLIGRAPGYWNPGGGAGAPLAMLFSLIKSLSTTFHGAYFLHQARSSSDPYGTFVGLFWTAATLVIIPLSLRGPGRVIAWSMVAAILMITFLPRFGYRYLLAIAGLAPLLVMFVSVRANVRWRPLVLALATLLAVTGLARFHALPDAQSSRAAEAVALDSLANDLVQHGVRHVISLDPLLQWNLMFASRGKIEARWKDPDDRIPAIPRAVDRALLEGGRVAVVGRVHADAVVDVMIQRMNARMVDGRFQWFPITMQDEEMLAHLKSFGYRLAGETSEEASGAH